MVERVVDNRTAISRLEVMTKKPLSEPQDPIVFNGVLIAPDQYYEFKSRYEDHFIVWITYCSVSSGTIYFSFKELTDHGPALSVQGWSHYPDNSKDKYKSGSINISSQCDWEVIELDQIQARLRFN